MKNSLVRYIFLNLIVKKYLNEGIRLQESVVNNLLIEVVGTVVRF